MKNIKSELIKFIKAQHWNFSPCNYATMSNYQKDRRVMEKDRQKCFELLAEIGEIPEYKAKEILPSTFSGRLSWDGEEFEYTAGQLYPIEVLASVVAFLEEFKNEMEDIKKAKPVFTIKQDQESGELTSCLIDWVMIADVLDKLSTSRDEIIKRHAIGLLEALKL